MIQIEEDKKEQESQCSNICTPKLLCNIVKNPEFVQLEGPLVHLNRGSSYKNIWLCLSSIYGEYGAAKVSSFLDLMFDRSDNDPALVQLMQATHASMWVTGNTKLSLKICKRVLNRITTYDLRNTGIVSSLFYKNLYYFYTAKNKPGKAHKAMECALSCIGDCYPCTWTSGIHVIQGEMYEQ